jgi:hypothetical protein
LLAFLVTAPVGAQEVYVPAALPDPADPPEVPTVSTFVRLPDTTDFEGGPSVSLPSPSDTLRDRLGGNHNFSNFINWMSNPLYNIDPRAVTAVYPLFLGSWVQDTPPIPNADFQVYGPAVTVALSDRFALGMNQGGFAALHPSRNPVERRRLAARDPLGRFRDVREGGERKGWLNLGGFFQYTLIEDVEDQFILTAGLRWVAPAGSHEIFQGHGPLELAPYLTAGKEFGKWHVLGSAGYQFPAGPGSDTLKLWYANVHIDRQCFGWLYPLVEFNTNYLTKNADVGLLTRGGYVSFGNYEALGTVVSMAAGANAVLVRERLEVGAVYSTIIGGSTDAAVNGLLVKMTMRY